MRRTQALCGVAILVWCLAISIAGCSSGFEVKITGVVRDALDGAALEGVRVTLERFGLAPIKTQADEVFAIRFGVTSVSGQDTTSLIRWVLVLAKEGYETEKIDITPDPTTEMFSKRIYVVAHLRRATADVK